VAESIALGVNTDAYQPCERRLVSEDLERRAFIHDGTTMRDLGRFTDAVAINASGQVVGAYAAPDQRAMSWTAEDGLVDLNTRLYAPLPACA
jgi:uncharacterized membrane protein